MSMLKKRFSQGHEKVFNYLSAVVKTEKFQEQIKRMRSKYDIPPLGYEYKKIKHRDREMLPLPPEPWKKTAEETERIGKYFNEIEIEIQKLGAEYGFFDDAWPDPLEIYLFYNVVEELGYDLMSYNLCLLRDVPFEKKMPVTEKDTVSRSFYEQRTKAEDTLFPIAIRISPNASLRDLLDYIKRSFPRIRHLQKSYINEAIKIGAIRSRKKSIQERNEFIWENRHLPRKELMHKGRAFKDFPDYAAVAKIISLEKKRRKEV